MALPKDLTILFGDISVAFMNTQVPEGGHVYAEPPADLYEHNDTVWCQKRALERFEGPVHDSSTNASLTCSHHDLVSNDHKHSHRSSWRDL